jgi:hypothetical protein
VRCQSALRPGESLAIDTHQRFRRGRFIFAGASLVHHPQLLASSWIPTLPSCFALCSNRLDHVGLGGCGRLVPNRARNCALAWKPPIKGRGKPASGNFGGRLWVAQRLSQAGPIPVTLADRIVCRNTHRIDGVQRSEGARCEAKLSPIFCAIPSIDAENRPNVSWLGPAKSGAVRSPSAPRWTVEFLLPRKRHDDIVRESAHHGIARFAGAITSQWLVAGQQEQR